VTDALHDSNVVGPSYFKYIILLVYVRTQRNLTPLDRSAKYRDGEDTEDEKETTTALALLYTLYC